MFLIKMIIIGAIAGWVAGQIWKGSGFGWLWNILLGIGGAFLGGILLKIFGFAHYGWIAQIIVAILGALLILFIAGKIKK